MKHWKFGAVPAVLLSLALSSGAAAQTAGDISPNFVSPHLTGTASGEEFGLITVRTPHGACSGSLLNNYWVITAAHCVDNNDIANPARVTILSSWDSQAIATDRIQNFRPLDVAIARLSTPMSVYDSTTGFRTQALGDRAESWPEYPVLQFGRGIYQLATPAGPALRDGQYRSAIGIMRETTATDFRVETEPGTTGAGGDSGGPTYVRIWSGYALAGVHSQCEIVCVRGQICGDQPPGTVLPPNYSPWNWVAEVGACWDAPVQPVWSQILNILRTETPIAAGPVIRVPPFQGTFATNPDNFYPIWVYAVAEDGKLWWYRQDSNTSVWSGPREVGTGWQDFIHVIPAGGTSFYAVTKTGSLVWYRHNGFNDGTVDWQGPVTVGSNWLQFLSIFSGSDGVLYAIEPDGDLIWYRNAAYAVGGASWTAGIRVGTGWQGFSRVFSMGKGVIYAVKPNGELWWYHHTGWETGAASWEDAKQVGTGWQNFTTITPAGNGVILAVDRAGALLWYKHTGWETGANSWAPTVTIGSNWSQFLDVVALLPQTALVNPPR